MNDVATPAPAGAPVPTVAKLGTASYVAGRRAFFKYRDLGVTGATGGRLRAQVTSAESGMSQPTGWHVHTCEAQFVYMLSGWIELEFAGEPLCRVEAGDFDPDPRQHAAQRDPHLRHVRAVGGFAARGDGHRGVRRAALECDVHTSPALRGRGRGAERRG